MNYLAILLGDPMAPILIGVAIGVLIGLLPLIFYLITLSKTLKEVEQTNRRIEPGQVWLTLIPLFGLVWQFIMVNRIADSLKAEFAARNIQVEEDRPGAKLRSYLLYSNGLWSYSVCWNLGIFRRFCLLDYLLGKNKWL